MTVSECLAITDRILPCGLDASVRRQWLSELEGRVRVELLGETLPIQPLAVGDEDTALIVPHPYDQMYWMYLVAMTELAMGQVSRYENDAILFNTSFGNYAKYLTQHREAVT